jgi:hypothetical protein
MIIAKTFFLEQDMIYLIISFAFYMLQLTAHRRKRLLSGLDTRDLFYYIFRSFSLFSVHKQKQKNIGEINRIKNKETKKNQTILFLVTGFVAMIMKRFG